MLAMPWPAACCCDYRSLHQHHWEQHGRAKDHVRSCEQHGEVELVLAERPAVEHVEARIEE